MSHIRFNPWGDYYKQPFGAIATHHEVTIRIYVASSVEPYVYCRYRKEGSEILQLPMAKIDTHWYECRFSLTEKGLYFYSFMIQESFDQSLTTVYYGEEDNSDGIGKSVDQLHQLKEFQLTCYDEEEYVPWYVDGVAYQIFPDRFHSHLANHQLLVDRKKTFIYGNQSDRPMYIKNQAGDVVRWDFFGGTLKGIEEKIPYLLDLGVTIVYLNPIFLADSNHRYDTNDYFEIDSLLGTKEDFVSLIQALHQNNIRVILDGVFSHVGKNSRYFNQDGRYGDNVGASRTQASEYYPWFTFTDYPSDYQSWWGIKDLPEVNKECQSFQEMIYAGENNVIDYWTSMGVDGWRLDVADELPDVFIEGIRATLAKYEHKILIGEVWEDASNKISYGNRRNYVFGNNLQGVMNYPFREAIVDLLLHRSSVNQICRKLTSLLENYPLQFVLQSLTNVGTHDTKRIYSELYENEHKFLLALSLLFVLPGVPCLYYGDERQMKGETDPDNRAFFPWHNENQRIVQFCQRWINYRKAHRSLQRGDTNFFYQGELFGCLRIYEDEWTVLFVNPSEREQTIDFHGIHWLRSVDVTNQFIERVTKQLPEKIAGSDFWLATFKDEQKIGGQING